MSFVEKFQDLPLEEVMGDRFGRYSKYIIQDRALPDTRDGLKPVQRRIMYAMFHEGNTFDKPFRKSAKTVGNVIGNYHPHGDTSVYDAMVRMSQDWKSRHMLVEMHGNNGSVDGDPPAAMRYTEARLSAIAAELLRDINKNTVEFVPNFDDQDMEPTVLPSRFPNLLVNGATGISAGYATDIPPHNLQEALDAVLMRLDNKNCTVDELMTVIKGPDFPTGGIIQGVDGIKKAYETGKGKIIVRSRTEIEQLKGNKEQIIITEIPFEVNKANMIRKMDELRVNDRRLDGISEIRDESDRNGLRIVVELKKDVPAQGILNFLLKSTDLQVSYNFNMIAIHNRRPMMMTLPLMLDAYIDHQKEIVRRRSQYDLTRAEDRLHIVEGLMKALSILDEVIETIRASKDKRDAKNNIIEKFGFSEEQAEAIVSLQLYRLTNTDITQLQKEQDELHELVVKLKAILEDEKKLIRVIKSELNDIKKRFTVPRLSTIEAEIEEIKVTRDVLVPSEEVVVTVTKDGYVKRTSLRSHSASNGKDFAMKDSDYLLYEANLNTQHHLLLFTSKGHYIYQPVHELPDIRWKDLGQHISSIVPIDSNEEIIEVIGIETFDQPNVYVFTATKEGQIKRSALADYIVTRYSKPIKTMNLKGEDEMIFARLVTDQEEVLLSTNTSYTIRFPMEDLPVTGVKTAGVKGIIVKEGEYLAAVALLKPDQEQELVIVTQRGAVKRMLLSELELGNRAKRGVVILKELKSNPHRIFTILVVNFRNTFTIETEKGVQETISVTSLTRADRYSNGSLRIDTEGDGAISRAYVEKTE
ncbi:DNA topoisomerase 4 subunit A [Solibacillus isronensis B3W22]|uniref:DNA topoisomerase 4 subunit A n=1 Tax=Solibacillus isronensis B3W22 TaxID=1224748 RepID=K1KXT7_9BACL|nr:MULTISPECIES: DNA topoisomerase IV subunit A [Solibacillus]AMO85486.1 DNA gyrase subunit A [Solibacillus silvestris]EKB43448.1 DNA topoisomerase 4 subunit A [Solibacillus isronensis B3W22]OBW60507.1 DNA topoisomerase IV subunit A [Solibacillus silvestris]